MQISSLPKTTLLFAMFTLFINSNVMADESEQSIEAKVRESFEQQMKSQEARIAKAEADLKRIKLQFERRLANAEQIIDQHAKMLAQTDKISDTEDPDVSAAVLASEGWKAWQKQDWRTALSKFESAIQKDPKAANTINGLGWTYLHLGEYDKSLETFGKAMAIDPTHLGVLNGIGQCLMAMGRLDDAKTKLVEATQAVIDQMGEEVAIKNGATASWFGLVRLLIQKGDYVDAKIWAERFLKHKPDDVDMQSMLKQAQAQSRLEAK